MSEEEHPNAALVRRVFAAFGKDPMAVSAAFARDIVWRVPGHTVMSGEYRGRREVVEFLRGRTLPKRSDKRPTIRETVRWQAPLFHLHRYRRRRQRTDDFSDVVSA